MFKFLRNCQTGFHEGSTVFIFPSVIHENSIFSMFSPICDATCLFDYLDILVKDCHIVGVFFWGGVVFGFFVCLFVFLLWFFFFFFFFFVFFFFFFFFFCLLRAAPAALWRFPGQGLNQSCSHQPTPQPQQHQSELSL